LRTAQLNIREIQSQQFATNFTFSSPTLGTLTVPRGWIAVDARMRGQNFRFVNTHLESFSPVINLAQARELLRTAGDTNLPLIFVGDFNTDAESRDAAYRRFINAGFTDVWEQTHSPRQRGFTWALFLTDPYTYTTPFQRLDLILIRGEIEALDADVVGENPLTDRTPSGLMRSDHAGVIASLKLLP
jgi:endonuclease/exonuclease/phosphatase family metal-dependent hydrolase